MHGRNYRNDFDVTAALPWRIGDILTEQRYGDDFEVIAQCGGLADFAPELAKMLADARQIHYDAQQRGHIYGAINPAVGVARKFMFAERDSISLFEWRRFQRARQPALDRAREIANWCRDEQAKRGAR